MHLLEPRRLVLLSCLSQVLLSNSPPKPAGAWPSSRPSVIEPIHDPRAPLIANGFVLSWPPSIPSHCCLHLPGRNYRHQIRAASRAIFRVRHTAYFPTLVVRPRTAHRPTGTGGRGESLSTSRPSRMLSLGLSYPSFRCGNFETLSDKLYLLAQL